MEIIGIIFLILALLAAIAQNLDVILPILFFIALAGIVIYGIVKAITNASEAREIQRIRREEEERIRREKEEKRLREEKAHEERQRREEEIRQRQIPGKQYDRIINCPVCFGNGRAFECYIYEGEEDDNGRENDKLKMYCIFNEEYSEKTVSSTLQRIQEYLGEMGYESYGGRVTNGNIIKYTNAPHADDCKFCQGKGIAYAWFENYPATTEKCTTCHGSGNVSKKVKLDIGVGEKQFSCDDCQGTGEKHIPEKQIVHVQTVAGGMFPKHNEEGSRIFPEYWEPVKINKIFGVFFMRDGKEVGDGQDPFRFNTEITEKNRNFFSTSKPRFS